MPSKEQAVGTAASGNRRQVGGQRKRRQLRDVRNPAVRAMLAEDGCGGDLEADDLSDLEDFIVCNPGSLLLSLSYLLFPC
jgi:hypothetical protein